MKLLKKLRRRIRQKNTFTYNPEENTAKRLIYGNWGIPFAEPNAKRKGQMRAREREDAVFRTQRGADVMTRQRYRHAVRSQIKKIRALNTVKHTKQRMGSTKRKSAG